jgi:PAS domain S-box-containing protein
MNADPSPTLAGRRVQQGVNRRRVWPFVLVACGMVAGVWAVERRGQATARAAARRELEAIADLKAGQIADWLKERRSNAELAWHNQQLRSLLAEPGNVAVREQVRQWMAVLRQAYDYAAVALFDARATLVLAVPADAAVQNPHNAAHVHAALASREVLFNDLHLVQPDGPIELSFGVPVRDRAQPGQPAAGVLMLMVDPQRFLYPLVQDWPVPSATAETLLVRREGEDVLFLNELRHWPGTALKLRRPVNEPRLPAAMAGRGQLGTVEGVDYRGLPVVSVLRAIRDAPWLMVAKVDEAEVYAPLRRQALLAGGAIGGLILAAALGLGWLRQRQAAARLARELAAERERKSLAERVAHLMQQANDIILITDATGRIVEANERAVQSYGYPLADLLRLTVADLRTPEERGEFAGQLARVKEEGALRLETMHQRRDGSVFPMEASVRCIESDGVTRHLAIVRDLTERKQAEAALHALNADLERRIEQRTQAIRALEARLDHLLSRTLVVLYSRRPSGDYAATFISDNVRAQCGYEPRQFLDDPAFWLDRLHPEDRERVRAELPHVEQTNRHAHEYRFRCADGNYRWYRDELTLVRARDGTPQEMVGCMVDITERKRLEEAQAAEARHVQELLAQAEKGRRALAGVLEDQRQAAAALREGEARLHSLFETMAEGVILIAPDGQIVKANPAAESILGLRRSEIAARNYVSPDWKILRPDGTPMPPEEMAEPRAMQEMRPIKDVVMGVEHGDGTRTWINVSASPILNAAGKIEGVVGTFGDITERKRAEAIRDAFLSLAARLSEARTPRDVAGSLFTVADGLWHWDAGSFDLCSPAGDTVETVCCVDRVGGQRRDVPPVKAQPTPRMRRTLEHGPELILRTGAVSPPREMMPFGDTTRRSASLMFVPVRRKGRAIGMVSVRSYTPNAFTNGDLRTLETLANDCSGALERIEAEAAVRASEEQYRTLVETSPESVVRIDLNGIVRMANAAAVKLAGLARAEELVGRPMLEFVPEPSREELRARSAQYLQPGDARPFPFETRLLRADGTTVEVELTGAAIRDADGQPTALLGIARDITQAREAQRRLQRSQRLESLGTLAGGIAHDLNNALAPIMMGMELLRTEHPGQAPMLDLMQASTKRAADMVRQLLTFAKGAEGARVSLQPAHLIKEMQGIIKSTFPKNIELELDLGRNLPTVLGDVTQLHQVLLNLCVNARDAMPHGGRLTLAAERLEMDAAPVPDAQPGKYLVLRVRDTGTGIRPAVLERVFEPFFTTKGPDKGTGLGLSTVLGIVEGHGGFVQVDSEPGKGSTFAVYLPVEGEQRGTEHLAKAATPFHGRGESVLLVDDEAAVREIGRAVLTKLDFTPLTASDGAEGILIATEHRATLSAVLLDLQMPHMDGVALAQALRRLRPDLPIAAMSGQFEEGTQAQLAEAGVTLHLTKPFTEDQLAEALRKLLAPEPTK